MQSERIRIRMEGYDHEALDRTALEIVDTAKRTHSEVHGPIPLPTRIERYTVLSGPNIDKKARKNLRLPDPRKLKSKGRVRKAGIRIDGFGYSLGGYSAFRGFPETPMRPPIVRPGARVPFTNLEAQLGMPDDEQVWHSITSCRAPCNRGPGIGYPLAGGPIKFDSGQLGYWTNLSEGVTTGSNQDLTPPLRKAGKTYTYFCRIHPFMRGSVRTKPKPKRRNP